MQKTNSDVSAAEMTFGRNPHLPGEFYSSQKEIQNESEYVTQLRNAISKIRPVPFSKKNNQTIFVHPDLASCDKVYVRVNRVKKPLEPPYDGPFKVITRKKKYFKIAQPNGKMDVVCIDRLKPA